MTRAAKAKTGPTLATIRRPPTPRPGVYDLYWHYAAERHHIFNRRLAGSPPPWTNDPILGTYKFCNTYRVLDRVTQDLLRTVAYAPADDTPADRLFRVVAYRTFSKPETWQHLHHWFGRPPAIADLAGNHLRDALDSAKASNGTLYTGAFILCANNAYGHRIKHHNHIDLFRHMFLTDGLAASLLAARSLAEVYQLLHRYPLMGDFMSYQTAIDLNYTELVNFSENDFTQPGPGALRGIAKCFTDPGDYTPAEIILWMVDRQQEEFDRLGLDFAGLQGRPLHAIDAQNVFCETDKYCREAAPELASGRTRIKARFRPTAPPDPPFLPPKWTSSQP